MSVTYNVRGYCIVCHTRLARPSLGREYRDADNGRHSLTFPLAPTHVALAVVSHTAACAIVVHGDWSKVIV